MQTLEEQLNPELEAVKLSQNDIDLRRRLRAAQEVLTEYWKPYFSKPKYDFEKKRLIGSNGMILQWQTRKYPNEPASYENQQTTEGTVLLLDITQIG